MAWLGLALLELAWLGLASFELTWLGLAWQLACLLACLPACVLASYCWLVIVVRLREDRRTPLHSWRSQMCRELLRILAAPARILREPCRFLSEFWLQNASAFPHFNAKKFSKNHSKMVPKPSKSIKMAQNGARSKKIAPRTEKDAKKHPKKNPPLGHPK